MRLTRRGLLVGAAAGGGLLAAWSLLPRSYPVPLTAGENEQAFNAWIKLSRDGVVTVAVPQLEMGQGVTTVIPRIAATELGADWRQVAVEPAAISAAYANPVAAAHWAPLWMPAFAGLADEPGDRLAQIFARRQRLMVTADGTGIIAFEDEVRAAAADVRAMLALAAAARWNVPFEECRAEDGFITHGDKRLRFAELADEAAGFDPPDPPLLAAGPAFDRVDPLAAEAPGLFPRLDAPSKVDGSFAFAGDIRLPGMVYAAIAHGPVADARLVSHAEGAGARLTGYLATVRGEDWLAAVANNHWTAERALQVMRPRFSPRTAPADSTAIAKRLEAALAGDAADRIAERGDGSDALGAERILAARYAAAPAFHQTLETATATARFADGRLELWLPAQAPEQARRAAAEAVGLPLADVVLYPVAAGGSFDARLAHGIAREIAPIAKGVGRPVQLTYSRWQEHLTDLPRPPALAELRARLTGEGGIAAWHTRLATPPGGHELAARVFEGKGPFDAMRAAAESGGADPLATTGIMPPYAVPHLAIDYAPADVGLPIGRLRGNADCFACFANESFIAELAGVVGAEPLAYRIALLGDSDPRLAACLKAAARLAGWNGGRAVAGMGEGIACHRMADPAQRPDGGGRIAVVARAGAGGENGRVIAVERLTAVCDIGRIIHRGIALEQIEGGLLYGLALALGGEASYSRGLPEQRTLAALAPLRIGEAPEITVRFVDSDAPPFDPGEIGVVAVAPAVANAFYSASGTRHRSLPLTSEVQAA